ncbi:MAG TPA: YlxM family DNA-binding protein [Thermoanaerobacterales bacterium]|jgi:predicted DNA-binding protein YlxM (UPF0122 family)|nr:YlxM family DNA-binding protein [Thermoanaerobacterales bacterium]
MDKITKINLLFDYYGDFLTEKQKEIFELYYCYDLSFGEIAEQYGITRQGVYDIVHRSLRTLKDYEKKLGMLRKYEKLEKKVKNVLNLLSELRSGVKSSYSDKFYMICDEVASILKEGGD